VTAENLGALLDLIADRHDLRQASPRQVFEA
jgi:hypothetical protein